MYTLLLVFNVIVIDYLYYNLYINMEFFNYIDS